MITMLLALVRNIYMHSNYSEVLRAKSEIAQVYSKNVVIDVEYRGRRTGQTAIPNAKEQITTRVEI